MLKTIFVVGNNIVRIFEGNDISTKLIPCVFSTTEFLHSLMWCGEESFVQYQLPSTFDSFSNVLVGHTTPPPPKKKAFLFVFAEFKRANVFPGIRFTCTACFNYF